MNGIRKFRPGVSVASYLPSRSTTHACCCGTTLIDRTTKMTATTNRTSAISIEFPFWFSDLLDHEPAADDLAHPVEARRGRATWRMGHGPGRTPVANLRGPVRLPGRNRHGFPDVHVDRGIG